MQKNFVSVCNFVFLNLKNPPLIKWRCVITARVNRRKLVDRRVCLGILFETKSCFFRAGGGCIPTTKLTHGHKRGSGGATTITASDGIGGEVCGTARGLLLVLFRRSRVSRRLIARVKRVRELNI